MVTINNLFTGTHLRKFEGKGVNFDVQWFTAKKGVNFGLKSVLSQKWVVLSWKVSVLPQKGGNF